VEYLLEKWGVETLGFKQGIDSTLFFYAYLGINDERIV